MSTVFFTDRDLGLQFPTILRTAGLVVERHADHFHDTAKDEEWLLKVGQQGWFGLTRDTYIRYKPNQRDAVMRAGVGLFVLIGQAPHHELAQNFVATIHRVEAFIKRIPRPFIAKVYRHSTSSAIKWRQKPGRVKLWLSYNQWLNIRRR